MGANVGEEVPEEYWAEEPAKRLSVYLKHFADSQRGEKSGVICPHGERWIIYNLLAQTVEAV